MRVAFTGTDSKNSRLCAVPKQSSNRFEAQSPKQSSGCGGGPTSFCAGMAPGVDLWAADELLRLRSEGIIAHSTRSCGGAVPTLAAGFDDEDRALYQKIAERADKVILTAEEYAPECYNRRNDYLADNADRVIAYWEGTAGGTRYTIERARSRGKKAINLFAGELF